MEHKSKENVVSLRGICRKKLCFQILALRHGQNLTDKPSFQGVVQLKELQTQKKCAESFNCGRFYVSPHSLTSNQQAENSWRRRHTLSTSAVMEEGNRQGKNYWKVELKRHRELLDRETPRSDQSEHPLPPGQRALELSMQ